MLNPLEARVESLYLHVPFCPRVCPYCDFHKMHRQEALVEAYLKRLGEEMLALHKGFSGDLKTIYFGGGTPSHLSNAELSQVIGFFEQTWGWPAKLETTLEADPLTFDKSRLLDFKAMGFSRLSIGLQSSQDEVLSFLERRHSGREGLLAVEWALEAGFEVSADLITGMSMQDTAKDLKMLAATGVPHISVYSLTIEPYTPFAIRKVEVNEDKEADDYELTLDVLKSFGFERYEVSSHAKKGHESKHNQVYWGGDYFLNVGPSASGFLPSLEANVVGVRRNNPPIKTWLLNKEPELIEVAAKDFVLDCLLTGLRTKQGVNLEQLKERSQLDVKVIFSDLIKQLEKLELLELEGGFLRLTELGFLQLNGIVKRFFSFHF